VEAIDHLHRLGCPPANAVGVEVTAIATDRGDRRVPGEPGGDAGRRAVRQEIDHPMRQEIDEDGAIAMPPPPGPLVDPDGLQGGNVGYRGRPHQPEEGGRTGRQPQLGGESGTRVPSQSDADGLQGVDQPRGLAGIGGGDVR
jgi:hypothetical protein